MKIKFRPVHIVIAAINAAAVAGALILTAMGSSLGKSQSYNYAAERWKNGSKKDYTQISCFFSEDAGFDINAAEGVKAKLLNDLQTASITPEEGKTLVPDAYSVPAGKAVVTGDSRGRSEAEITAVGGDFFLFHDLRLVSGSFFNDKDLMQDGAIIDRHLAWSLYGSDNIVGKFIYINDVKLYISGVTEAPSTDAEERCTGDTPGAYISYYAAGRIFGGSSDNEYMTDDSPVSFKKVTCYECISPDPVEKFAYNSVKERLSEVCKGKMSIVNNTGRFASKTRIKALKQLDDSVVQKDGIVYPFWENASRMVEFRLSFIYGGRRLLLDIPLITLVWLIVKAYKAYRRKKEGFRMAAESLLSEKWTALRNRTPKKSEEAQNRDSSRKKEQTKESKNISKHN